MDKDILAGMQFLCEAMFGAPGISDFWEKEAEQARSEGRLFTSNKLEEYASFAKSYNNIKEVKA